MASEQTDSTTNSDSSESPTAILSSLALALHPYLPTVTSPILPTNIPPSSKSHLYTTLPAHPTPLTSLTTHLLTTITPYLNQSSLSPNYYGFVTGGVTPAALTADVLASVYDQNVAVHLPRETISTTVEAHALNMLLDLFGLCRGEWGVGLPGSSGGGSGTFTTGATASNVLGLALGREYVLGCAVACAGLSSSKVSVAENGLVETMAAGGVKKLQILSTMPHSSIAKAASLVGIGRANVVSVAQESEGGFLTIDFEKLESELRRPGTASIVVVSAGEVNTGRFATGSGEEMARLRKLCDEYGSWIHLDGAFGLFARVLRTQEGDEFQNVVAGLEGLGHADSITGDGHKMLNVPYDCGIFLTRHKALAEEVCMNGGAAYLTPPFVEGKGEGVKDEVEDNLQSPLNIGIENSRRFRALPVYATLVGYGQEGYVDMVTRQVRLARRVAGWLWEESATFEVLPRETKKEEMVKKTFTIVLFRAREERMNKKLVKNINATGKIYVSGTKWEGRPAARIAVSNWRVDVERDLKVIQEALRTAVGS